MENAPLYAATIATHTLDADGGHSTSIKIAFTSTDYEKLSTHIENVVGCPLLPLADPAPATLRTAGGTGGFIGVIKGGLASDTTVGLDDTFTVCDLDAKSYPISGEAFMDIVEGYTGSDLKAHLSEWVAEFTG